MHYYSDGFRQILTLFSNREPNTLHGRTWHRLEMFYHHNTVTIIIKKEVKRKGKKDKVTETRLYFHGEEIVDLKNFFINAFEKMEFNNTFGKDF